MRDAINIGVSWQRVLDLADHHNVRPLLLQSLKSVCWDLVPESIKLELEHFNTINIQKNLSFAAETLRLVAMFREVGIQTATFKGAVLAEGVYGDLSLREFSDLDLIVPEPDVCEAERVLTACGYKATFPDKDYRLAFLRYHGQYAFHNPRTGLRVDLHWRFCRTGVAFALQPAEIWPRLANVSLADRSVPTLAKDDLALFLAAHGTKEGWKRLAWVCDFAELLRAYQDINWLQIHERAQRARSSRALLLAILLASDVLDAPAPLTLVNEARKNAIVRSLAEKAITGMLQSTPNGEFSEFVGNLKTHDHLWDRISPLVQLLTTRTVADQQAMPLPKSLWGVYYVTRPFRLAGKGARMLLGSN